MTKRIRKLAFICVLLTLLQMQMPSANAQIVQALLRVASGLAPVVIPMALSSIPMVMQAAPAIPAYIRENCPHPHIPFVGRKSEPATPDNIEQAAVGPENSEEAATAAPANEMAREITEEKESRVEESVSSQLKTDNSEWFLEEDHHGHGRPVSISTRPIASKQSAAPAKELHATELKATPLALPAAQNEAGHSATVRSNDAPHPESARRQPELLQAEPKAEAEPKQEEAPAAPVIMMKVAE